MLLAPLLLAMPGLNAVAGTISWTGASGGLWSDSSNWNSQTVPGPGDDVLVNLSGTYTIIIDSGASFNTLIVGAASGTQSLSLTNGTISGVATLLNNAVLNLACPSTGWDGVLTNYGKIVWAPNGPTNWSFDGARLENMASGLFDLQMDGSFDFGSATPAFPVFDNAGILRKSGGTKIASFTTALKFNNSGLVDIQSGALQFLDGFTSSGAFNAGPSTAIQLVGGIFTLSQGNTFGGSGFYGQPGGGTAIINGPIINTNFQLSGGTLVTSDLLTGVLQWSGGTLTGALTVTNGGVLNITATNSKTVAGTITNYAQVNWQNTGPAQLAFVDGEIDNLSGGVFNLQMDGTFFLASGTGTLNNSGILRKSAGPGAAAFSTGFQFTNSGLVDVLSGTLQFPGGFTSSGTFSAGAGTAIQLIGGTFTLNPGHTFTGSGYYGEPGGGTAFINGPIINNNFQLTGGTLISSNQLAGTLQWNAGILGGALTVASGGVINFGTTNAKTLSGTIINSGQINWLASGPAQWNFNNAQIQNQQGGQFNLLMDGLFNLSAGTASFNNAGTLQKSGGTGVARFPVGFPFTNSGTVNVLSGALQFPDGFTSTGTFNAGASGSIQLVGGTFNLNTGHNFTGTGFYGEPGGGTAFINGPIAGTNFQLSGGTLISSNLLSGILQWSGGVLSGAMTVMNSGVINYGTTNDKSLSGIITNYGRINWQSNGTAAWSFNSSRIENMSPGLFDLQMDGTFLDSTGAATINNAGTIQKSAGSNSCLFAAGFALANSGTINLQSGAMQFIDGFTSSGAFNTAAGTAINLVSGTFNLNPGHTFTGPGFYGVPSGTPYLNGPIADTNFQFTSGTMTISNQLTGTLQWSGGNLAGALTIKPGGILNLRTPAVRGMTAAITNSGRINWQPNGPTLFSVQNSRIENLAGGVFDWQTDGVFTIANSPATFNNYGTLRKSGGTGTSGFPTGFNVNNVALFDVQSGTLQLPDLYQQFGGQLNFGIRSPGNYGNIAFLGTPNLKGSLSANSIGGYLPVATNIFTVITYPSFSGGFTGTNLFALNFPNAWQTSYNPTSVTLTVINTSPILGLSVSGTNLTINWPGATDPSFVLQSTTNLSPPIPWVNVTNTVSASGNQNTVTIPILVPKLFLRMLSSPQ